MRLNGAAINSVALDGLTRTASAGGTAYTLTAATGTFTLSGQTAGLRVARRVAAASRAFTVSGQTAVLRVGLTAGSRSFALTGQAATLTKRLHLLAGSGTIVLTGGAVADRPGAPQAPPVVGGGSRLPFHGGLVYLQRLLKPLKKKVLKKVKQKRKETLAVHNETERLEVHAMPIAELEQIEARAESAEYEEELMLLLLLLGEQAEEESL